MPEQQPWSQCRKTKVLIVDFRSGRSRIYEPIFINGSVVERISNFKFLGMHISEDLFWDPHIDVFVKKAHQRISFLGRLRRFSMSTNIPLNFYRFSVESILTVASWFDISNTQERRRLQKVVDIALWVLTCPLSKGPTGGASSKKQQASLRTLITLTKLSFLSCHQEEAICWKTVTSRFRNK